MMNIKQSIRANQSQIMMALASLGALISLYLWYSHITQVSTICFTGCDVVLQSKYSEIIGVPVAAYGFLFYISILALVLLRSRSEDNKMLFNNLLKLDILVGLLFTLYLRYVEFFKIGDICMWCWGSVVVVVLLAVVFWVGRGSERTTKESV